MSALRRWEVCVSVTIVATAVVEVHAATEEEALARAEDVPTQAWRLEAPTHVPIDAEIDPEDEAVAVDLGPVRPGDVEDGE